MAECFCFYANNHQKTRHVRRARRIISSVQGSRYHAAGPCTTRISYIPLSRTPHMFLLYFIFMHVRVELEHSRSIRWRISFLVCRTSDCDTLNFCRPLFLLLLIYTALISSQCLSPPPLRGSGAVEYRTMKRTPPGHTFSELYHICVLPHCPCGAAEPSLNPLRISR